MSKQAYSVTLSPLPVAADEVIYFDKTPVSLPCIENIQTLHYHDRYEIGICQEGEGVFLFEDRITYLAKGDAVLIPPGIRHYSRSLCPQAPCLCRFVYVDKKETENLLGYLSKDEKRTQALLHTLTQGVVVNPTAGSKEAAALTALVETCKQEHPHGAALVVLRLVTFLLDTCSFTTHTQPKKTREDTVASALAEHLSIHYDQESTLRDLSKLWNLSQSQLCRRFVRAYGMPPMAYKNQLRCQIAAQLLTNTQLSVSEIAARVGYRDLSNFYRAFKQCFGIAPTVYRSGQS